MSVASGSVRAGFVCALGDPSARDPRMAGSKAAALATTLTRGLPICPGFVVTTQAHGDYLAAGHAFGHDLDAGLRAAWAELVEHDRQAVIVRSSSTVEDVAQSSMAGRFRSVLDVRGYDRFRDAVAQVWASADEVAAGSETMPMGVLVQRQLEPTRSGVMFGVDPVTGDRSTIAIDAVAGGPDKLVSGQVSAQHYVLTRHGRLLSMDHQPLHLLRPHERPLLNPRNVVALARLARTAEGVFGSPQDVEWALTDDGTLWLLQSRPVTATAAAAESKGPVLGPGPLGETFPDPLGELEIDLWVRPLRAGVVDAMTQVSAVPAERVKRSPVVTTVNGRVAADLELFGYERRRSRLGVLDPRPAVRQMRTAWRTGVVRASLPADATRLVREVDSWLSTVDIESATDEQLLDVLDLAVLRLQRVHHLEVLAGTLLHPATRTAASLALDIAADPAVDLADPELLRRHPVLLSLVPPCMHGPPVPLPEVLRPLRTKESARGRPSPGGPGAEDERTEGLSEREHLRLRARWLQELTVRAARRLGHRWAERGILEHAADVDVLRRSELRALLDGEAPTGLLVERRGHDLAVGFMPPLPARFRLAATGDVVPAERGGIRPGTGTPAGGGRGVGAVCHGSVRRPPSPGDVLVVRTLEPGLAGCLPGLAGLVAETGASLSHLAILAREYGVPTVVGVHDALGRFSPGTRVLVDGATGEVRVIGGGEEA